MRTELTPDNREVQVADVVILYIDSAEHLAVSVVIDDYLAANIETMTTMELMGTETPWDNSWSKWDAQFFYYFTESEWEGVKNDNHVSDEWVVVVESIGVTA